jgi:hypothetical protein
VAVAVLAVESVTAAALLFAAIAAALAVPAFAQVVGPAARAAFGVAAALLAVFVGAQVTVLARGGKDATCACFGRSATRVGPVTLTRDVILLGVAVLGLVASAGHMAAGPAVEAVEAVDLVAALAGLVLGVLIVALEDIVALFAPIPSRQ